MKILIRNIAFATMGFLLNCQLGLCDVTRLPADALDALNKPNDFVIQTKVDQIPKKGRVVFNKSKEGDDDIHMADAGQPFQVTDVIMPGKELPFRQLQFAAISKNYLLIHNATGGVALGYYYVLLKKKGSHFEVIWIGTSHDPSTNFQEFLKLLKTNKIDDRDTYFY